MGTAASVSSNDRRHYSQQPSSSITEHIRQLEDRSIRRPFLPSTTFPCSCSYCNKDNTLPPEKFLSQGDLLFHHRDNHTPHFLRLLDDTTSTDSLIQSLTFLSPGDLLDISNTCRTLYLACESSLLFKPYGKGVYSRIHKTYIVSKRASSLAKTCGIVMQSHGSKLRNDRKNLTSIVEGNRIHLLKIKRPNAIQTTTATIVLILLDSEQNSPEQNLGRAPFRKLRELMLLSDGIKQQTIVSRLQNLDILTLPTSNMLKARSFIELLRKDLKTYNGLNPNRFNITKPGDRPNKIDLWTSVVSSFCISFNAFWHCSNFACAANNTMTATMSALNKSKKLLDQLHELEPVWYHHVDKMQTDHLERASRYINNDHVLKRAKARKNSIERLSANGYIEIVGHSNIHELLETHSDDWKHVLEHLQDMHPPSYEDAVVQSE